MLDAVAPPELGRDLSRQRLQQASPIGCPHLATLDGSGEDALIYGDSYNEGWYRRLMRPDANGAAERTSLTGDGA